MDHEPAHDDRDPYRRSHLEWHGDELTWTGDERADELSRSPVVDLRQRAMALTLYGYYGLLALTGLLSTLAMVGVAAGWFDEAFVHQTLALTLGPSFTAWLLAGRWVFPSRDQGGGGHG